MMKRKLLFACCLFALHAGAQTSIDPGTTVGATGSVQFTYNGAPVTLSTVRAADNNIWLQQNLGSTQVATSQSDAASYGHYFQFGRWDDGHQIANSTVVQASTLSANNPTGIGTGSPNFYTNFWSAGAGTDTWSGTTASATNGKDPCAALGTGWRLPTAAEWTAVKTAEGMDGTWDAATIPASYLSSNLKISRSGQRTGSGGFNYLGAVVVMWSSSIATGQPQLVVSGLGFNYIGNPGITRDAGATCRCIKTISTPPPTGCTGTPTAPVMTSTATAICSGNTTILVATDPNTSTGLTYQWQQSATGVAGSWSNVSGGTGATTLNYTTATLTTNTYFRVVTTCTASTLSAAGTSVLITVNPAVTPAVTIAADATGSSICEGTMVTFTATPANGGSTPSYQWKKGSTNVGTNSATYTDNTLTATDIISCVMTGNAPCASAATATSNTIGFTVNTVVTPSVVITATPSAGVCEGSAVSFEATQINGGTAPAYQWFNGSAPVGTNNATYSYTPANGDAISCVLTSDAACASVATDTSDKIVAVVYALPAKPVISVSGSVLNSSTANGNQWYKNNVLIPAADDQSYSPDGAGYYQVSVTDEHGCSNKSDSVFYEPTTGIGQYHSGLSVAVYPSPFKNTLQVSVQDAPNVSGSAFRLVMTNQLGQVVHTATFKSRHYAADLSGIASGIYFLHVSNDQGSSLIKVVKE